MLNRLELLFNFLGCGILFFIGMIVIKRTRSERLPSGSIILQKSESVENNRPPGNRWSQLGVTMPFLFNKSLEILIIILCFVNIWEYTSQLIAIDLPLIVNWIGIIGLWLCVIWSIAGFYYNVNFTRLYKPLPGKYILATGGPYKYIRHPFYVGGAIEILSFILSTGIWIAIILLVIYLITLPFQARGEEKVLREIFGTIYDDYASKTGRFFPKI
ncbi:MAG TPA: isoprenylcysteine carboxylmethyltransferase family protein [Candidatus Deferrimicrobium sp.]|nr:isoprenylcysteine carboxylmethyltransferase family protein [Candidatus Deferrimicrobium sp.]